jgi:hypothetical protein
MRVALADYAQLFRAQEVNKRMREKAARFALIAAVSFSATRRCSAKTSSAVRIEYSPHWI